jgi:hypothetical protein
MTLPSALQPTSLAGPNASITIAARLANFASGTPVRVVLLLVACLVPRVIVACKLTAVCDDGYLYLHVADALERGRWEDALEYLNLNIYSVALVGLHKLGLEWTTAGKLWGVLLGTAIALPLFDWLRRMFDERIATVAVFLYAVHPKLIEWSVEPIREATFWFLFVVGIDFLWRSFDERRWWQFGTAGGALALALFTRFEGWFLLAPLAVWGAVSWRRVAAARARLAFGTLVCLAMTPLLLLTLNVTLLAHHPRWEFGRLTPFTVVTGWFPAPATQGAASPAPASPAPTKAPSQNRDSAAPPVAQAPTATAPPVSAVDSVTSKHRNRLETSALVRTYGLELVRSLGVPFLVLAVIGFFSSLGRLRDPRVALLPIWSAGMLLAIAVQLVHAGQMNGRYFLTLALVDAGFAATGCLTVMRWLQAALALQSPNRRLVAAGLVPVCLLAAGWAQSFSTRHTSRRMEAKLGRWTKTQVGPVHRAVSDYQAIRAAYFATGGLPEVVKYDDFFDSDFDRDPPDLLVIDPRSFGPRLLPSFLERATDLGLVPLDQQGFSSAPPKFTIYVRRSQIPARPASTPIAHVPEPASRN